MGLHQWTLTSIWINKAQSCLEITTVKWIINKESLLRKHHLMNSISWLIMPWTRTMHMCKDQQLEVTQLAPVKMMVMASNTAVSQWLKISFHLDPYQVVLAPIMAVVSFNNLDLKANFQVKCITKWTTLEVTNIGQTTRIPTSEIQSTKITTSSIMLKI